MGGMGQMVQGVATMAQGEQQGEADYKQAITTHDRATAALNYDTRLALQKGATQAGELKMSASELAAKQGTAYANSGVDSGIGTAANVQAGTQALGELDAQTARNNAAREAWGYQVQKGYGDQDEKTAFANSDRKQAATMLTGMTQFASGAASMGGK